MAHSCDIVAYMYNADLYCGECIVKLVSGDPDYFHLDTEEALNQFAQVEGIDREDEATFDSGDFPKVVLRDQLDGDEHCGHCHTPLEDE